LVDDLVSVRGAFYGVRPSGHLFLVARDTTYVSRGRLGPGVETPSSLSRPPNEVIDQLAAPEDEGNLDLTTARDRGSKRAIGSALDDELVTRTRRNEWELEAASSVAGHS
jgi:hypothetical protein